jgi:hypothetical protein
MMGTPTAAEWPAIRDLPTAPPFLAGRTIRSDLTTMLHDRVPAVPSEDSHLMTKILQWKPNNRVTAEKALKEPLFKAMNRRGKRLGFLR